MNDLEFERENLSNTIAIINNMLENEKNDLDNLYNSFDVDDIEELWRMAERMTVHIENLKRSVDNPYFARIDFVNEGDSELNSIYIGKKGIMNNNDVIVTDWRAPISSLYYDAEIGKCSFTAPEGIINGDMKLKRQFEIEDGNLIKYYDVDLVSNDSLLQKYLNDNNESRLKSIVATIQKEQNDVIRKNINENLIIQGVAGSGKTTVALHRIAYLVYNYIKNVNQNQYLVIGPNPVFLKYIKSVLPELDVSGVKQCTFEEFAINYINENIVINQSDYKLNASISGNNNMDIDKFKCSIKYKEMLDKFIEIYLNCITSKPLMLGNFEIISKEKIKEIFDETDTETYTSLKTRIDATMGRMSRFIENNNLYLNSKLKDYYYNLFDNARSEEEKLEYRNKYVKERDELSKGCKNILRRYFSKIKANPTDIYKIFINSIDDFDLYNYVDLNMLKKETLTNIKNKTYDFEDLAALIYIKSIVSPTKDYKNIKHVVVDEAQDLGEFNFYILKKCLPLATFSIFGDIAQSIYDYRGINNWDEVNDIMFRNKGNIINFNKSYRTTSQIMSAADDVAESINLGKSDLVVREGKEVSFKDCDFFDIPNYICNKINEYKEKGYKSIAVISKTDKLSQYINYDLKAIGMEIPNVTIDDDLSDEKFRICTISNQLAKGLEFDAVIINNASENVYSSANRLDMKLLYVAITRALHELDIVYFGELTKPLEKKKGKMLIK